VKRCADYGTRNEAAKGENAGSGSVYPLHKLTTRMEQVNLLKGILLQANRMNKYSYNGGGGDVRSFVGRYSALRERG
jgi:hypothetical protein